MDKRPKRPRDINVRAASTVALATGEITPVQVTQDSLEAPEPSSEERHDAAVMLGRKGGQARAKKLTPKQRTAIAKEAAKARWQSP